jgi:glycosyltransferase involved in cell wall biosynthesis
MPASYTAYIPVFNQALVLGSTLAGLREQSVPPAEIFVVDDGSTDGSGDLAAAAGATVLRQPGNLGRGAARARALTEARHEFVLCADAGKRIAADFAARGLEHFARQERLAAVHGRVGQPPARTLAHRWRGRHLFLARPGPVEPCTTHNSGAAMVRRAAVRQIGNYNAALRAHEDDDLGRRLVAAGWEIWYDPAMLAECLMQNNLPEVFARYARWFEPRDRGWSWRDYPHNLRTALRVMAPLDWAERDWPALLATLALPHYLLWRAGAAPATELKHPTPPLHAP